MTSSWLVHNLFMTHSKLVLNLLITCLCIWLVHDLISFFPFHDFRCSWLVCLKQEFSQFFYDLFMPCSQTNSCLIHDLFIASLLQIHRFFMIWFKSCSWLIKFLTCLWPVHDFLMTCSWLTYDLFMTSSLPVRIHVLLIFSEGYRRYLALCLTLSVSQLVSKCVSVF